MHCNSLVSPPTWILLPHTANSVKFVSSANAGSILSIFASYSRRVVKNSKKKSPPVLHLSAPSFAARAHQRFCQLGFVTPSVAAALLPGLSMAAWLNEPAKVSNGQCILQQRTSSLPFRYFPEVVRQFDCPCHLVHVAVISGQLLVLLLLCRAALELPEKIRVIVPPSAPRTPSSCSSR